MNKSQSELYQKLIPVFINSMRKYTVNNPVKSEFIEQKLTEYAVDKGLIKSTDKIKGTDVRAMVSFLCSNYIPVGSGQEGYYWATNITEYMPSIMHISSRAFKLVQRMHKMHLAVFDENEQKKVIDQMMRKPLQLSLDVYE